MVLLQVVGPRGRGVPVARGVPVRVSVVSRDGGALRQEGGSGRVRVQHRRPVKVLVASEGRLRVEGCQGRRGLASVGEAVLESALDHVVVVEPAVGLHNFGFAFTRKRRIFDF